jgi:hypothetical protein
VSALPIGPPSAEDPLDPERILHALPEQERDTFLTQYQRAEFEVDETAGLIRVFALVRTG